MNPDPKPGTGALLGHQWEPWQLAKWCYEAGWQDAFFLTTSVQVILAESQGYDHAIHVNLDGSRDRGIWQLNDIHKHITDEIAYDPVRATAEAFKLYAARNGWEDWAAYTSGVFLHDSLPWPCRAWCRQLLGPRNNGSSGPGLERQAVRALVQSDHPELRAPARRHEGAP